MNIDPILKRNPLNWKLGLSLLTLIIILLRSEYFFVTFAVLGVYILLLLPSLTYLCLVRYRLKKLKAAK